jgi:hypothetical protein
MGLRFTYFPTSTLPRLHSIVWCRIPEDDGSPGLHVRPALVRSTKRDPTTNRGAVWVSYGTANLNIPKSNAVDLVIQNYERLRQLGLPHAVRFDLGLFNWPS